MAVSIHLRDCAKTFPDGTRALEPVSLDIAAGETVVLLGPSGCGKTTTLRIIAGLESPDAGGRVLFADDDVTALPIEKRGVGMVFQSYALFPNMTVAQNVGYGLRVRGVERAEREKRVAEMLELVDLTAFGSRGIDQLSGGQRQRVALGDRIVVMEKGRIAQAGTPHEIYHRPATAFVADFIGTMNRVTGEVVDGHLVWPTGRIPLPSPFGEGPGVTVTTFMFRPEDTRIVSPGEHHLEATIISSFFLGDHTRLVVDAGMAAPLIVETTERRSWPRGERVHLAVAPGALLAVPAQMP